MLLLNHVYMAIAFTNLLHFACVKCEVEIVSASETANDYSKFCPITNSIAPVYIPHPKDCSSFFICDSGIPHLKSCPPGLHFNRILKACDYPKSAGCGKSNTIEPKDTMIGEGFSLCPAENSKDPTFVPHPDDCSKFYICDSGSAHLKECHPGLHFNQKIKACDYPQKAGCDSDFKELPKDKGTGGDLNFCPSENSKYPILLPDPNDCSKFYICDNGLAHLKECQLGLHFNQKINTCDYPLKAKCDKGIRRLLSAVPSPFCPSTNGKVPIFYRHSTNCSMYYMCSNGFAYEFLCPARLHFNVRKKVCDYEFNSGCQNTNQ